MAPGVGVRVRLAGKLTEGYVLSGAADFRAPVTPIASVVSDVPVLTTDILALCREVATHYAGSVSDVVRLAVPPRVAGAETGWRPGSSRPRRQPRPGVGLAAHPFVVEAAGGVPVRGTWVAPAGGDWADQLAAVARVVTEAGRSVVLVAPDARDVARLAAALRSAVPGHTAVLTADEGPRDRYSAFLDVLSGQAHVVVGTRAAAFAPVLDPGLLVVWDDGDSSLAEQRAPYPHAREVLALRSHLQTCALLLAGHTRSAETQRWLDAGWCLDLTDQAAVRSRRPHVFSTIDRVRSPFDLVRRLPQSTVAALRTGLDAGPVLVQVSRRGYLPLTACQTCRELAECPRCGGPLEVAANGSVQCRRCSAADEFHCPSCGGTRLRAVRSGASRTAEELGRLFGGIPVLQSTAEHPVATVAHTAIVVATAGVEPIAAGGYTAGAILDAQEDLWRVGVRSREEAGRRWFNAAALLRPGAPLALSADSDDPVVQALIRWDPGVLAADELKRRTAAGLPPAQQVAQIDGSPTDLEEVIAALSGEVDVLGPREITGSTARALLRSSDFPSLRDELRTIIMARSARHRGGAVRVQVDPVALD